jgi:hypothetical protein
MSKSPAGMPKNRGHRALVTNPAKNEIKTAGFNISGVKRRAIITNNRRNPFMFERTPSDMPNSTEPASEHVFFFIRRRSVTRQHATHGARNTSGFPASIALLIGTPRKNIARMRNDTMRFSGF